MTAHRKLIALDFDGVLHAYTTPWTDAATISDGPTEGAMQFLKRLVEDDRFEVCIVSSRCKEPAGVKAIWSWLEAHLESTFGPDEEVNIRWDDGDGTPMPKRGIRIVDYRPPAFLTIDDRAWTFNGTWPGLDQMAAFRPWNKQAKLITFDEVMASRDYAIGSDVPSGPRMEMSIDATTTPPTLTVLGATTPCDDLMIDAISQGMSKGEAARTRTLWQSLDQYIDRQRARVGLYSKQEAGITAAILDDLEDILGDHPKEKAA